MPTKSDPQTFSALFSRYKYWLLIGLGIILLAAILRFVNLNSLPVFADESIYVRWSQVMRAEPTLRFLPLSDGKQPLFMWTVIPFLKFISDPLIAGRMLSGLIGLSTVVGVGVCGYLLFKNLRLSVSAALIWAVLPYSVFFDRMALADGMLTAFIVWTFAFSLISFKHLRWDFSMLAGFALGFAALTKSPATFAAAMLPLLALLGSDHPLTKKRLLISLGLLLTTYTLAFAMYNILRLGPEFHLIAIRNQDYLYPLSEFIKHPADPLIPHLKDSLGFYLYLVTPVGVILAALGLIEGGLKHWRQRLLLTIWCLAPIVAMSALAKTLTARYLYYTVPFVVILASHALWHFGDRTKKHFLSFSALGLLVALSIGFDYFLITAPEKAPLPRIERSGYLEQWTAGQGIREAAAIIRQAAASGPVLVGSEGFFGTPFSALQMYLNDLPQVRVIGIGQNITAVDSKLTNSLTDNQVFFVANSSRILVSPETLNLEIISAYPKATNENGDREYLIFAKVLPLSNKK
jgi:4-amino-4-deoxy-L-arabinose transferase-like glycosyltransferase